MASSPRPPSDEKISAAEAEELIADWTPKPLLSQPLTPNQLKRINRNFVLESAPEATVTINGKKCTNLASFNFLGLANSPEVKLAARKTIEKYGVGSCGPRGFYGTIDTHLELEQQLAQFFGTEEAIIYSDGITALSSVISSFSKKDDLIICDDGVNYCIRQGLILSRSHIQVKFFLRWILTCDQFFKHNDMKALNSLLESIRQEDIRKKRKITRRFIVAEGVYMHDGQICHLGKLLELKEKYHYRMILDDSLGLAVLGRRGSPEYHHIDIHDIDIYAANAEFAFSVPGGFCTGNHYIVDHQRLSSLAYVFSASCPPYECIAALAALNLTKDEDIERLQKKGMLMRSELKELDQIDSSEYLFLFTLFLIRAYRYRISMSGAPIVPIIYLRLIRQNDDSKGQFVDLNYDFEMKFYEEVINDLFEQNIVVALSRSIPEQSFFAPPSIMIYVTIMLDDELIRNVAGIIKSTIRFLFKHSSNLLHHNRKHLKSLR